MTGVNRVLVDYIDFLKGENASLRVEVNRCKVNASNPSDIRKAAHDASNIIGDKQYAITDPDATAVAFVLDMAGRVVDYSKAIRLLQAEIQLYKNHIAVTAPSGDPCTGEDNKP